ncbi:DUF2326 domain-containing protein [Paucibacter sp. APW11]|uniref:DUF2326 domain-containing protein n=1 Tax=Roseateles aquae TaxID=3077235 RepID=A0ABU3PDM4_9BURK|nr:DUF2326 domain-containing protein [Paucibacter sp. APW11]MDT9000223.1 DUF2326 domain-containing protein [Paucibacter sp. APW11]
MFLKSLRIEGKGGLIRHIKFHAGLNLIVDETPTDDAEATGNNVGKTTVLMLIDFCLGASAKGIYTDPETKKNEDPVVKDFLINNEVLVSLTLTSDLADQFAVETIIERNFLSRSKHIRRINGQQLTEQAFEEYLTNQLFPGHFGKKPTFGQITSHNIRYKDLSVSNTLKTLNSFTRDDEYETLYLFLLGCNFDNGDAKQNLLASIRAEASFKARLESKQTRSAYEASLALLQNDIERLNAHRANFNTNPNFENDLQTLDKARYQISLVSSKISRLNLRKDLIQEAIREINSGAANIDVRQLELLYKQVSDSLGAVSRSFAELVTFHNRMIGEKAKYIEKDLPKIVAELEVNNEKLQDLLKVEKNLSAKLSKTGSFESLERIIVALNEAHRKKGEYEAIIDQITRSEKTLAGFMGDLEKIDDRLFSEEFEAEIQQQVNKFNEFFASISRELYGEEYALKFDPAVTKTGQKVYKFSAFNTNFSSGKKQGEITCFDIAYTLFADAEGIPCYHFLLNDKKELMHDNQLVKIAHLVHREKKHTQFVASILRDKLPAELNQEHYFVVRLSQAEKLFKIEQA